jgi:hypothetical protein
MRVRGGLVGLCCGDGCQCDYEVVTIVLAGGDEALPMCIEHLEAYLLSKGQKTKARDM